MRKISRITAYICASAILLSSCAGGEAPAAAPIYEETSASSDMTENTAPPETATAEETTEAYETAETTEAATAAEPSYSPMFSLVIEDKFEEISVNNARSAITARFDGLVNGAADESTPLNISEIRGVRLNSWEVKKEEFAKVRGDSLPDYAVTLTLDVAESNNEFIPVGMNDYLLVYSPDADKQYMPLRIAGTYDFEQRLPNSVTHIRDHVSFCNDFEFAFAEYFEGDDITDFSAPEIPVLGFRADAGFYTAMRYFPELCKENGLLKLSDIDRAFKSLYGFSAEAFGCYMLRTYDEDTDTVIVPDGGWAWYCGDLAEDIYNENEKTHTVTIEYFSDDLFLVRARTCRYTVRENVDGTYTMLRMERLFMSGNKILYGEV